MDGNLLNKTKVIIRFVRPKTLLWFSVSTCYGFGCIILQNFPLFRFTLLVLVILLANIGAIIVNDIGDVDVDSKSMEKPKRNRPLVTKAISTKQAIILSTIFYLLSIFISLFYGLTATFFSISIILFSLSYSLPPFKFCARPYGSVIYWIILCLSCYLLLLNALATSEKNMWQLLRYTPGWVFITAIIFYMGIAEIIAKDLRDFINDKQGGRNTFVNFVGVETAARVMLLFAWLGFILWMDALYLTARFPHIASVFCLGIGLYWCVKVTVTSFKLSNKFDQQLAATLHQQWTYTYAAMQLLTFLSFINNK